MPLDVLATDSPNLIGDSQQRQRNIDINPAQVPRPKASNEYRRRRVVIGKKEGQAPDGTLTSYGSIVPSASDEFTSPIDLMQDFTGEGNEGPG